MSIECNPSEIRMPLVRWIVELDRILRGDTTCHRELFRDCSKTADIRFPVGGISVVLGALGACFGICMAVFTLVRSCESGVYAQACFQVFANLLKVPLLFVLTICVTFPSLYVFNALIGSRLKLVPLFRLLIASLAVNLAVLASLGPIVAFFSLSSPNYSFIVLLNVIVFAIAGFLGLGFLVQTLRQLNAAENFKRTERHDITTENESSKPSSTDGIRPELSLRSPSNSGSPSSAGNSSTPGTNRRNVDWVISCWMVAFGLVGAQMGWILRPFVGAPSLPFEFFRSRNSNFFSAVTNAFFNLF